MTRRRRLPAALLAGAALFAAAAVAAQMPGPASIRLEFGAAQSPQQAVQSIQILLLLTLLAFVPAMVVMTSSFTRILIVLSLLRQALGLQQTPPNQVVVALSLIMTLFIMRPQLAEMNDRALQPYLQGRLTHAAALKEAMDPLRRFMLAQTRRKDLSLFTGLSKTQAGPDVPTMVLIPAFVTSELKTAFQIGFLVFIPFILVDLIVASILMSMGMVMVPPILISLPFKLLLFVLIDGWHLLLQGLMASFR